MKLRYLSLLVIICLVPVCVWAWGIVGIGGGVPSDGACLSGTYSFHWDGDYATTTTACIDSGGSTRVGTQNGGDLGTDYGESGSNGFLADAEDEYIRWPITDRDLFNEAAWTIFIRVKIVQNDAADHCEFTGPEAGANNWYQAEVEADDDFWSRGEYDATPVGTRSGTAGEFTRGSWVTIGFSGETATGNYCACYGAACDSDTWECDADSLGAWGVTPAYIYIGDMPIGDIGTDDDIYIDRVLIINSYQASIIAGW